jgi:hypothetical protein
MRSSGRMNADRLPPFVDDIAPLEAVELQDPQVDLSSSRAAVDALRR